MGAGSTALSPGLQLLGAVELQSNDGRWDVPEGRHKTNAVLTLSGGDRARGWSTSLMSYDAHWTSTDQIPQRLIDAGRLDGPPFDRFDSVDPSDGGNTRRSSLSGEWHRRTENDTTRFAAYAIDYRLKLFSNFTYALERPSDGDQFPQKDDRTVYGIVAGTSSTTRSAASLCAASSACSCGTTASARGCSTPPSAGPLPPRATTRCARRWRTSTGRPRSS